MIESSVRRFRTLPDRALDRGALAGGQLALPAAGFLAVGGLAFANGGFFPVAWGWAASALLWLTAIALALGVGVQIGRLEAALLTSLGGLTAWIFLSGLWTSSVSETVLEGERVLVYLGAAAAGILLLRRLSGPALLTGIWAAVTLASAYGVATRLFPGRFGTFDAIAGYRLSEPLGYWNAVAGLAAMGTLLALGLAARGGPVVRCLAAASTVVTLLALYFTYSRGGWIAFFAGLAVAIAIDPRRLQLLTTGLVLLPWPVLAIVLASRSDALTHETASLEAAAKDGHGLAVLAIMLMVAAALAALALDALESSLSVPYGLRRLYAGTLAVLAAASLIVVFGRYGLPPTLARKAYHSFNRVPPGQGPTRDLNKRLFSLSGNGRVEQWRIGWRDAEEHPWLGSGAGTYGTYWFQHRPVPTTVHDAHNLYLETLAELGPVGLMLLAVALGVPLAALRRARSAPLAAAAAAAYVTYLLHAAGEWDWEMPALTLTALFCGLALLAAARREDSHRPLRPRIRVGALAATVAVAAFAVLGLLGNAAVSASSKAASAGNLSKAESQARRATDLAPWASAPWRRLGEAQLRDGKPAAARRSFREALTKEPRDWTLWFELATASRGRAQRRALAQALHLNPLSPELTSFRRTVEGGG